VLACWRRLGYIAAVDALPKPDVILTHESDLDGFVAGLLLPAADRHLFQTEARLEAYNYNGWKLRDLREKSAWGVPI